MKKLFDLNVDNVANKYFFRFYLRDMSIYYEHGSNEDMIHKVTTPIDFTSYFENKENIKSKNVIDLLGSTFFDICINNVSKMYYIETDKLYVHLGKDELFHFLDDFCYRIDVLIENDLLEINQYHEKTF